MSYLQARIVTTRHEQERARGHTAFVDIAQVASHQVVGWIVRANQLSACQARALLKLPLERRLLVRLKVDTARGTTHKRY